jgi:thiol-disulfide isomerase/thioredoxin
MDSFIVGVQLLLAGVFGLAGGAKLFDLQGSRRAIADFGVPKRAASVAGSLLPFVELATAVALLFHPTARWGASIALLLLVAFSLGIANAMLRGRAPDCHCFGQVHSAPAGPGTLARNLGLAGLAGIVVGHGPAPAIDDWVAARSAAELVAIGAALITLALAALAVRRWSESHKPRRAPAYAPPTAPDPRRAALPVGTVAPNFALQDLWGETHTLESLRARGRPVVLQFVDPTCAPCRQLVPLLARWQATLSERVTIAVVTTTDEDRSRWEEQGITDVLVDRSSEAFRAFRVPSTPKAIGVEVDGRIAAAPAGGLHMPEVLIRLLIRRAATGTTAPPTPSAPPRVLQVEPDTA